MVKMASLPSLTAYARFLAVFVVASILSMSVVRAQTYQDRNRDRSERLQQQSERPTRSSNLPRWAEPAEPRSNAPSSNKQGSLDGSIETNAPPPGDEPVPVDGGLALLAAAGAGYAFRKLNEENEDEDPV